MCSRFFPFFIFFIDCNVKAGKINPQQNGITPGDDLNLLPGRVLFNHGYGSQRNYLFEVGLTSRKFRISALETEESLYGVVVLHVNVEI